MASGTRRTKSINKRSNMSENDSKLSEFRDNFNKKLSELYESQCGNLKKPWWKQRVLEVINEIKSGRVAMNAGVRRTPGQYYWISKYDIMQDNGKDILILKKSSPDDPTIQIVASEDYFDLLFKVHNECGHGGRDKMRFCTKDKYYIQRKAIEIFLSLCPTCDHKRNLPKKSVASKPIVKDFNVRGQFDLIDFQSTPDEEYKWVLFYQDHATKFVHLRPLRSKEAPEVALELLFIFLEFGAPCVLQSGSSEFAAIILEELVIHWPESNITNGTHHPQTQVEKNSQDIESLLRNWMRDKRATNWSLGCRFVQYERNLSHHKTLGGSPYQALFGFDPKSQNSNPNDREKVNNTPQTSDVSIEIEFINSETENTQHNSVLIQDSEDSDIETDQNVKDNSVDEIQAIANNDGTHNIHTMEFNITSCPVCGLVPSGTHFCQSCLKPVHTTCGTIDENKGKKIQCFICRNEGTIKKEQEVNQSVKRVREKDIDETAKKRTRLDIEENPENDTIDVWSSFEKESGETARCTLCLQTFPTDGAVLKTHLLDKHPNVHEKQETEDNEDEPQNCYTEVLYLENNEQIIKTEPKQRPDDNQPEPGKTHNYDEEENEEIENFGKYITSLLKNLPKDTCTQLQMEIVNLIMTAKLKSMTRHMVPNRGNSSKDDPL